MEGEERRHMWNGCSQMRERVRTERGDILNENGDKMNERDMQEEGKNSKKGVRDRNKNVNLLGRAETTVYYIIKSRNESFCAKPRD
jgi:hypothetical protein